MTYAQWIFAVDKFLIDAVGMAHDDMEDYLWHDEYEAGAKPSEAATDFLIEVGAFAD